MIDWHTCCRQLLAKNVTVDEPFALSLIKTSENKKLSEVQLQLTEVTAASKVSLAYDSLRELLEAVALRNGYKIYNHECYGAFLKEVLRSSLGVEFDTLRKIRNSVNYYGKQINSEEAKDIIERIYKLRAEIKSKLMVR